MNDKAIQAMLSQAPKREAAFRLIMNGTKERIYRLARKMVGEHDLANEVVQQTYIKVFKKVGEFEWKSSLESWIYKIAVRTALDLIKQQKRRAIVGIDVAMSGTSSTRVEYDEAMEVVREATGQLPERQREVFVMRFYEDLSFEEIAEQLGGSESGLRSTYHHAKRKIKEELVSKGLL
jgi:RNA polymerase sigma-70 factor (ECF subfamily)